MPAASQKRGKKRKANNDGRSGPPYKISCPALPLERRDPAGDYSYDEAYPGEHQELKVGYTIEPGYAWRNGLKSFSKMKYQQEEIKVGDFVYINKDAALAAAPPDLNNDEMVTWHRDHSYVGRIQQIKAVPATKTDKVFLMIFYLYWPEELPRGRANYHGKREVVLSNHPDLIEAQAVSDFADIAFWDEDDDTVVPSRDLYYRQTYDISKVALVKRFSELRKHCECQREHHPDKVMYHCSHRKCLAWNHEECLEDALAKTLKNRRQQCTLLSYLDERAEAWQSKKESQTQSLGDRITTGAGNIVHRVRDSVMHHIEGEKTTQAPDDGFDPVEALTPGSKQKTETTKAPQQESPIKGQLEITIKQAGSYDSVVADVTLLPDKDASSTSPRSWEIQLDCLVCKQPLD